MTKKEILEGLQLIFENCEKGEGAYRFYVVSKFSNQAVSDLLLLYQHENSKNKKLILSELLNHTLPLAKGSNPARVYARRLKDYVFVF